MKSENVRKKLGHCWNQTAEVHNNYCFPCPRKFTSAVFNSDHSFFAVRARFYVDWKHQVKLCGSRSLVLLWLPCPSTRS